MSPEPPKDVLRVLRANTSAAVDESGYKSLAERAFGADAPARGLLPLVHRRESSIAPVVAVVKAVNRDSPRDPKNREDDDDGHQGSKNVAPPRARPSRRRINDSGRGKSASSQRAGKHRENDRKARTLLR